MSTDDPRSWMFLKQIITGCEDLLLFGRFWMAIHVPDRIFRIIRGVQAFVIGRQPSLIWFRGVHNQGPSMAFDVFEYLLESRIVRHDVVPVSIFQLHPDIFPNLHSRCSIGEVAIELSNRGCSKIRLAKLKRVETGAKRSMAVALANNAQGILQLLLQRLPVRVMVIDQKNVEDVHMQALKRCVETRVPSGNVSMSVDRIERGECPQLHRSDRLGGWGRTRANGRRRRPLVGESDLEG